MPEQALPLSLNIPLNPPSDNFRSGASSLAQSAELSADSQYSNSALTLENTSSSPSFEFSDVLSPDAYNYDVSAAFAQPVDQVYQYLSLGQAKHSSQPNTPTTLQTAFSEQWLGPSSSASLYPTLNFGGNFHSFRSRSQTLSTPLTGTRSHLFSPYNQPSGHVDADPHYCISSISATSSFGPFTPASASHRVAPPTPFTDLEAKDNSYHARMPSAAESVSSTTSMSSVASSVAGAAGVGLQDLPLPALINGKPPRFKPTPRQLSILLHTYDRTK